MQSTTDIGKSPSQNPDTVAPWVTRALVDVRPIDHRGNKEATGWQQAHPNPTETDRKPVPVV